MVHLVLIWWCCVYVVLIIYVLQSATPTKMVSMFLALSPPFHCLRVARLFGRFIYFLAFIFLDYLRAGKIRVCVYCTISRITYLALLPLNASQTKHTFDIIHFPRIIAWPSFTSSFYLNLFV